MYKDKEKIWKIKEFSYHLLNWQRNNYDRKKNLNYLSFNKAIVIQEIGIRVLISRNKK